MTRTKNHFQVDQVGFVGGQRNEVERGGGVDILGENDNRVAMFPAHIDAIYSLPNQWSGIYTHYSGTHTFFISFYYSSLSCPYYRALSA